MSETNNETAVRSRATSTTSPSKAKLTPLVPGKEDPNRPLVELTHVEKHFGALHVLKDINLTVAKGEVLVVVGPSGSGKSTMCRTINRLETIDSGDIRIDGKPLPQEGKELANLRAEVGMVFQSFNLFANKTILENVTLALIKVRHMDKKEAEQLAMDLLARVGVDSQASKMPSQLSGGQQQRVALARAVVIEPSVLLFDEPLSNLDAKLRNQMRAEIIKLRERIDTTFIYVTHDQTEAMTLGDRIVIMKDGFIQQIGTPQEVFDHPANLFVAGFIGMPQMNFFDAKLTRQNGRYAVTVGGVTVELSDEKQQRLAEHNVAEQDVTLGVRPDHLMLCADGIKGTVDVSEMMGSSVHLHVAAEGKDVIVIVPTNGAAAHFPMGSEVNMIFGGNVAHVFDKETGKNLEW